MYNIQPAELSEIWGLLLQPAAFVFSARGVLLCFAGEGWVGAAMRRRQGEILGCSIQGRLLINTESLLKFKSAHGSKVKALQDILPMLPVRRIVCGPGWAGPYHSIIHHTGRLEKENKRFVL